MVRPEDLGSMRQGHQYVIEQEFMRHPITDVSLKYAALIAFAADSLLPGTDG